MIQIKNLTKKFNDFTAVDNISLSVNEGEIFAFLGPNGAGKTTTIKIFTTLLGATSGAISINGFRPVISSSFFLVFIFMILLSIFLQPWERPSAQSLMICMRSL